MTSQGPTRLGTTAPLSNPNPTLASLEDASFSARYLMVVIHARVAIDLFDRRSMAELNATVRQWQLRQLVGPLDAQASSKDG